MIKLHFQVHSGDLVNRGVGLELEISADYIFFGNSRGSHGSSTGSTPICVIVGEWGGGMFLGANPEPKKISCIYTSLSHTKPYKAEFIYP